MVKITVKELESLTVNDAGRILREDGNLAGRISIRKDGVSVSFFYRYRWGNQNKEYACGTWPRKSLTDIRKTRNQARALIDEQINPNEQKKTAKAQAYAAANVEAEQLKTTKVQTLTVQDLVKAWLVDGVARKDGNAEGAPSSRVNAVFSCVCDDGDTVPHIKSDCFQPLTTGRNRPRPCKKDLD
jgi:hypothetical protein